MRDFKNMKRQRGRNRGGGGNGGGGGGKLQHNANRAFDSNGPDNVKIRGHAQHVFEKYQQLARDSFASGDRVLAENYLQHADHYFRVLRTLQPQRTPSEILGRDVLASGLDIDFEEEFEAGEEGAETGGEMNGDANGGEPMRAEAGQGRRDERYDRGDGRRDTYDSRRDERDGRNDRYEPRRDADSPYRDGVRNEAPRAENPRAEAPRGDGAYRDRPDNRDRGERFDRGGERQDRFEGRRDNRRFEGQPRREDRPFNREGRFDERRNEERRPAEAAAPSDPLALVTPEPTPQPYVDESPAAEASPVLRSEDGGMSEAPAFLQPSGETEARKPRARRRRAPRSFETGSEGGDPEAAAPAVEDA